MQHLTLFLIGSLVVKIYDIGYTSKCYSKNNTSFNSYWKNIILENDTLGLKSFLDGFHRATSRQGFAAALGNVGPLLAATGVAFAGTFRNEIANLASK